MGTPAGGDGRGACNAASCCFCCEAVERVTGLVVGIVLGETGEVGGGEPDGT